LRGNGIQKFRKVTAKSNWVFSGEQDEQKHLVNIKRPWKRLLQKATLYLWSQDAMAASLIKGTCLLGNSYTEVERAYKTIL
jgi:hypothetical protein